MTIDKFFTHAIVVLIGMIVAALAAYYVLAEFIAPSQVSTKPIKESFIETENKSIATESMTIENTDATQTSTVELESFTGMLEAVDTSCFSDGECSVTVDSKQIIALVGRSQETVGTIQGVEGFGDLEKYVGKRVAVYAKPLGNNTFTLYGDAAFYIRPLEGKPFTDN